MNDREKEREKKKDKPKYSEISKTYKKQLLGKQVNLF
jgi:hypothetical protein